MTTLSPEVLLVALPPGDYQFSMELFDGGYLLGKTLPLKEIVTVSAGADVSLDIAPVQTSSFAAGSPATLMVYINGNPNFVPPTNFTWDGGSNHIEIRGGTTTNTDAMVALDTLTIRPR